MASDTDQRFMIDHMVIKLGTYLRILGYDAIWNSQKSTHELIRQANREHRAFCTRNRRLPDEYPPVAALIMVSSPDPVEQLRGVIRQAGLDPQRRLFSRCIRCNQTLEPVRDWTQVRARVHPNVYARFDRFYSCPSCHTIFWHGSHVRNTCRKLGLQMPPP